MNNPLSDGNESVIDIFVLGRSEEGTLELIEHLENQEYRVTLFTEGPQLLDTLRSGKPNLIICDTTSLGQEAYEYCRQIKSDDYHWMIPVMILTRASSLGDLLYVLDSNADNFISYPYDFPYLLSLVEGMLQTPVERQTTEQIKTQFKIQHDNRVFVVTADRRKLLEFLLSAFEIAVKNSEDLSSAQSELQELSSRLAVLEDESVENARVIGMLRASLKQKEQEERTLKGDLDETEQALDEKTAEAGQFSRDLADARTHMAAAEEHIRMLLAEKENTAASHQSETSLLAGQVSSLSQEINAKRMELESAQRAIEEEKKRSAMLDLALKEVNAQKEQSESSLQAITIDHEHLTSDLASEKNRALAAEQEIQSVLQAKTQSEENLTLIINELKDSAQQQNDVIVRLQTDIEAQIIRGTSAETRLETLRHEMEQSEAARELEKESQKRQLDDVQGRLDTAVATIFSQERELKILKDELVIAHADEKKTAEAVVSVTTSLNEARVEIEEREWKVQSLEKQIADAASLKEKSDENVYALTASLERAQSELNTEKEEHAALKEQLQATIRERDETLQLVRGAHEQAKTELGVHKKDLSRLNYELEAAALLRSTLQGDITVASLRIKELEHELKTAGLATDQHNQQIRALAEELDVHKADLVQVNSELGAATLRNNELEHELKTARLAKDQYGKQVQALEEERDSIKTALNETRQALFGEKEERATVETRLNAAIRERDATLQSVRGAHDQTKIDVDVHRNELLRLNRDLEASTQLNSTILADFNTASSRIKELEKELDTVVQGREQTDQQVQSLSGDLERVKAELEAERESRRTAEVKMQESAQVTSRLEGDVARSTAEREQLKSAFEQERMLHMAAVEQARIATLAKEQTENTLNAVSRDRDHNDEFRAVMIQKLNLDLEQGVVRQRDLEQKVTSLESQRAAAEERAAALSDEIQQARTALADQWEDHMNTEEQRIACEKKATQVEQTLSGTETMASEPEHAWAVVVKQTGLPAEIRPATKSVVVTNPPVFPEAPVPAGTPDLDQEVSMSSGIEDLFEDDPSISGTENRIPDVPEPSDIGSAPQTHEIITDDVAGEDIVPADEPADGQESDEPESVGDDAGDPRKNLDQFMATPSSYGISFSRQQWFDLLKWSHHSGVLSQEQRMQLVRMGRLIQNGRKVTKKQEEQIREMIVLVQNLGYQFH